MTANSSERSGSSETGRQPADRQLRLTLRVLQVLLRRGLLVVLVAAGILLGPLSLLRASDRLFSEPQRQAIGEIVREYLLEHPELILEVIQLLREREQVQAAQQQRQAIVRYRDQLHHDANTPVVGNQHGDVTIVEFFDYQCVFCKEMLSSLQSLLERDRGVRLVLKEYPVLGSASPLASKAALAAREQGLYWEFHRDLMAHRGRLNREVILRIAAQTGLDVARLKRDMEGQSVGSAIERNLQLGRHLKLTGTPSLIIGGQVISGAIGLDRLQQLIDSERQGS